MKDSKQQLSPISVILHWLVAITVITLIAAGTYMVEFEDFSIYPIHKSIGMIIFDIILIRVAWRIYQGWPIPVNTYTKIEQILSKFVHWILILGTLLMPISGMIMSAVGGYGLAVFGFELFAANFNAAGEAVAFNAQIAEIAHETHEIIGKIMIGAIILHIIGALKHHIVDQDGTLRRIYGINIEK